MTSRPGTCSDCGAALAPNARFCTECGSIAARRSPIPAKAIGLILGVSVVLLGAIILFGGGSEPASDPVATTEVAEDGSAELLPATTAAPDLGVGPLSATDVSCSGELPAFPCRALIDGDPSTAWNVPGGGEGAEIRVLFDTPTRITSVLFYNLDDDERLMRNARIREVEVHISDSGAVVAAELESGHGPYRVRVTPDPTQSISIHIVSTYPGEHIDGNEPFDELALQELRFTGITPAS